MPEPLRMNGVFDVGAVPPDQLLPTVKLLLVAPVQVKRVICALAGEAKAKAKSRRQKAQKKSGDGTEWVFIGQALRFCDLDR